MMYKIFLSIFPLLTLATCQSQSVSQKIKPSNKPKTHVSPPKSTPVKSGENSVPEMSSGLPPNREAVKNAQDEQSTSSSKKERIIYLSEGENKFVKQYDMNMTFKEVTEDSRCPTDVNCIWEGVATAEVELMGLSTRPLKIKLNTMTDKNRGYSTSQNFNGYTVTLMSLTPETTSAKKFKALKGSYKIGLRFEKTQSNTESGDSTMK